MAKGNFIRSLRQLILLTILLIVAGSTYLNRARSTSWEEPLWVTLYPIVADGRQTTTDYIDTLTSKNFIAIERFMEQETRRYAIAIGRPVRIDMGLPISAQPPAPPQSGNPLRIALWSFKICWWANRVTKDQPGARPNIRLFLVYHDPEIHDRIPHSLGLREGMLGVAHIFADRGMQERNNFVIAHEMLHTLGASDKYAMDSNLPIFPIGYAEPDRAQRYPQRFAEIMGGQIPVSDTEAVMPDSLKQVRVGRETALEIRWLDSLKKEPVKLSRADGQVVSK